MCTVLHYITMIIPLYVLSNRDTCNTVVNSLTVNLDDLLIQLRSEVSSHWYQFGQAIGIEKEILDNFAQKCSPEECIVETLDYWLRNHTAGRPNWSEIVEALIAINLIHLAQDIEALYLIGNSKH